MFGFIKKIFGLNRSETEVSFEDSRFLENKKLWKKLVDSDFKEEYLREFAMQVRAQDLPPEVFSIVISAGSKDVVSYFFEVDPARGDVLSEQNIGDILDIGGLKFVKGEGFAEIKSREMRALRVLTGYAALQPAALARLMVSNHCVLVALALWRNLIMKNEKLLQIVASIGGYQSRDLKGYCRSPKQYVIDEMTTLREADIILIETIRKYPDKVFDILFTQDQEVA